MLWPDDTSHSRQETRWISRRKRRIYATAGFLLEFSTRACVYASWSASLPLGACLVGSTYGAIINMLLTLSLDHNAQARSCFKLRLHKAYLCTNGDSAVGELSLNATGLTTTAYTGRSKLTNTATSSNPTPGPFRSNIATTSAPLQNMISVLPVSESVLSCITRRTWPSSSANSGPHRQRDHHNSHCSLFMHASYGAYMPGS